MSRIRQVVGGRVLLDFDALAIDAPVEQQRAVLEANGFHFRRFDPVDIARSRLNCSRYKRSARMADAPMHMDCSTFVKWVYGIAGVWLPRLSVQQAEEGDPVDPTSPDGIRRGDLVFMRGEYDRSRTDDGAAIGHVGIATGGSSVIHMLNAGIREESISQFLGPRGRAVRRVMPDADTLTAYCPEDLDIETTDDIYWFLKDRLER